MPEYICTMGPSIYDTNKLLELCRLGLTTIRFNMSHIDYDIFSVLEMIRQIKVTAGYEIETMIDTCGPEVRVITPQAREIKQNDVLVLGQDIDLTAPYEDILDVGDVLKIDDGKVILEVIKKDGNLIHCLATYGGKLKNRAGVSSDKLISNIPFISDVDLKDIEFAFAHNLSWVACSFVKSKEDLLQVLALKSQYPGCQTQIMSKIETPKAVDNLDDIIALSDGIMVARGDLGVALPPHLLGFLQNHISDKTNKARKKLVVGTGILKSMKTRLIPERAEVLDLYNTFLYNTNTIMFSGETAIADNPASILKMANDIYDTLPKEKVYFIK